MKRDETHSEPDHAPVPKYLVPAFVAAMVAWGLYLGIGAAFPETGVAERGEVVTSEREVGKDLSPSDAIGDKKDAKQGAIERRANAENFRPWRGVVVVACTAMFLAWFWGLQRLYLRRQAR